jgi:uncharacterized protein YjbI with pentapeptide repeats
MGIEITEPPLADESDPFRSAVLDGSDFSGSFIIADFTSASLRKCRFSANVKTCKFDGANLDGAVFDGAAIDGATFQDAAMTGTSFAGATAFGYTFAGDERP